MKMSQKFILVGMLLALLCGISVYLEFYGLAVYYGSMVIWTSACAVCITIENMKGYY